MLNEVVSYIEQCLEPFVRSHLNPLYKPARARRCPVSPPPSSPFRYCPILFFKRVLHFSSSLIVRAVFLRASCCSTWSLPRDPWTKLRHYGSLSIHFVSPPR